MSNKTNSLKLEGHNFPLKIKGQDLDDEIMKPFNHITSAPGKRLRQNLIQALAYWIPLAKEKVEVISKIANLIHNASLTLDDIQDSSPLRRGIPTAHTVFGTPRTIVCANYIMSTCHGLITELGNYELTKLYFKKQVEIFAGQGMDVYWRDKQICPSEAEYFQMVYRKTSLLFLLALTAMNMCSPRRYNDADKLITAFGLYFQINDDYSSLHNQVYFDAKGFCEDITEGKFSFPVIHAMNNFPKQGKILKKILSQHTNDVNVKKRFLAILDECGSFEYTRKKLEELKGIIDAEVAKLDKNPIIEGFLQRAMNVTTYTH